jgi:enoyl-CoA hydratase/carnithine racemase
MSAELRYDVSDHVAEITLARAPVNALNLSLLDQLLDALRHAAADDDVRAVVLTSALPRQFCAGLDLSIMAGKSEADVRPFLQKLYVELADIQHNLGKPSIAAVNGAARGGGMTLSILCDFIVAGESASFGYPEINVGVVPAIHFVHLPRIVGRHRAFDLLFTGRSFGADEATSLGLVSRVVADADVQAEAHTLARAFAAKSPSTMREARAAFIRTNGLDRASIEAAVDDFCRVVATPDAQEGLRAFSEKRAPKW